MQGGSFDPRFDTSRRRWQAVTAAQTPRPRVSRKRGQNGAMTPSASLPLFADASAASHEDAREEPPHCDLVTVTRLFNTLEAEMLRGCLEAEGIPAILGDVQTAQTDTRLTIAMGGVRVMVPAPFADAARQTVDAFERGALAIDELPPEAEAPFAPVEVEPAAGLRLSRTAWIVLAVVVVAVVVF
jgi:hypothetical protein